MRTHRDIPADVLARFWDKVNKNGPGGCWLWTASVTGRMGYGGFTYKGRGCSAHRWLWTHMNGKPPKGMYVDHICNTPRCVNPAHLQLLSPRANTMRGVGPSAVNARKTHCIYGHPFDAENTYVESGGWRKCRVCHRRNAREAYRRRTTG